MLVTVGILISSCLDNSLTFTSPVLFARVEQGFKVIFFCQGNHVPKIPKKFDLFDQGVNTNRIIFVRLTLTM